MPELRQGKIRLTRTVTAFKLIRLNSNSGSKIFLPEIVGLSNMPPMQSQLQLSRAVHLSREKILTPAGIVSPGTFSHDLPVLVMLAAGKGTRFGKAPKCIQPVGGIPLARHTIDAFRSLIASTVLCLVNYREDEVMASLGGDIVYIHSADPTGGTAFAAYEIFSVPGLCERNPIIVIAMGDRIVYETVLGKIMRIHSGNGCEAQLTLLSALYQPPRQAGKGRILRDSAGRVQRIVEQPDIDAVTDAVQRRRLHETTEANCPLYVIRAATLRHYLGQLTRNNAQNQYYITDIAAAITRDNGEVRTLTISDADPEHDLLCADVTRPRDLALLEGMLNKSDISPLPGRHDEIKQAALRICRDRPVGQVAAIAAQISELLEMAHRDRLGYDDRQPVSLGISGGRLRIAFMHPDMGRFFAPAWQMPIGAADATGREQIVVMLQKADDGAIHLFPADFEFREKLNMLPADNEFMYPGEEVTDWYSYEGFGTHMTEQMLLSLGYFSDQEINPALIEAQGEGLLFLLRPTVISKHLDHHRAKPAEPLLV